MERQRVAGGRAERHLDAFEGPATEDDGGEWQRDITSGFLDDLLSRG